MAMTITNMIGLKAKAQALMGPDDRVQIEGLTAGLGAVLIGANQSS